MFLHSLEVKNYRSLEHIKLEGLSRFNVLIGRNNSGKSTVFSALAFLNKRLVLNAASEDQRRVLTDLDLSKALELCLVFEPNDLERAQFCEIVNHSGTEERLDQLLKSRFLREIEFYFSAPAGAPDNLHLHRTSILTEDGQWATVQRVTGSAFEGSPSNMLTLLENVSSRLPDGVLNKTALDTDSAAAFGGVSLAGAWSIQAIPLQVHLSQSQALTWLRSKLVEYLGSAFFFDPFRHSTDRLEAQDQPELAQDGSDLVQVLKTIEGRDRSTFEQIELFVHGALPDVGRIHVPYVQGTNKIEVDFRSPVGDYRVRLDEMGGGVEQLLMAATVLLTTGNESTLFLEEPESHLHAGAQRFLIQQLYKGHRQVFLTTHSPTFINITGSRSLYQVVYAGGRTSVTRVNNADSLGAVLEDIGARNSDVLLSDAVLFVEGKSDRATFSTWSEKLGVSLAEHNVTLLTTNGGEYADRTAPIRSDLLAGVSQRAPVPHLFVLDRDQRSTDDVVDLQNRLEQRVHVLKMRELENYLLVPRAIREALREKCATDGPALAKIDEATDERIHALIEAAATSLYGIILLKRIRAELGGLIGGFLPREAVEALVKDVHRKTLPSNVYRAVEAHVKPYITKLRIEELVIEQKAALDEEWLDEGSRLTIAPGTEILEAVFSSFGVRYRKVADTKRIAQAMHTDEIDDEIVGLLRRSAGLSQADAG